MLVYSNNNAFVGSGNITNHGLGFSPKPNIEIGVFSSIEYEDWKRLFTLIDDSILVDDDMYQRAIEYRNKYRFTPSPLPDFVLKESDIIVRQQKKDLKSML